MLALVKHDLGNGHTASLVHVLWGFCFVYIVYMCLSFSSFSSSASESVPCLSIRSFTGLLTIMHTYPAV